jgi:TrmH family RNA methyltransferase
MSDDSVIRSRDHPLIKRIAAIRAGREAETVVLEGDRLIEDAIGAGLALEAVLVADDRKERIAELERSNRGLRGVVRAVDAALVQKISALKTSPGSIALCPAPRSVGLDDLALDQDSILLVVAGVADPGNLGAIARCAEAFGARAIVIARGGASPWNDKALRGSMGSLLRILVSWGDKAEEIADALAKRGVRQCSAATRGGADPLAFDWRGPCALWISGETGELPAAARKFETLTIPMTGRVESLNVTVAAALLLFTSRAAAKSSPRKQTREDRGRIVDPHERVDEKKARRG